MNEYTYGGARALVLLHERALRDCLATWRRALQTGVTPPACDDPAYGSTEGVMRHVLGAARWYMQWTCETLGLPDPQIREAPELSEMRKEAGNYAEHLLARWRLPLRDVTEKQLDRTEAKSSWGVTYCVDGMLEHAVMHPIRHEFQMRSWLEPHAA